MESEEEEIDFEILRGLLSENEEDEVDENFEDIPNKKFKSEIDIELSKINELKSKHNLSNVTTVKIAKLVNTAPGVRVKIPQSKKAIQKSAASESVIEQATIFVFCCDRIVLENRSCSQCKKVAKKKSKENNYIVHFSLISQVKRLITLHFNEIKQYMNRERSTAFISDIDDGILFKKLNETFGNQLVTLTLNADGGSFNNSGGNELWPVQLYLNCLPPSIRYLAQNIIVTTLYYGKKKPRMSDLLFPLTNELESSELISIQTSEDDFESFRVRVLIISCDIPARTAIQNFVGPNGYYGCPYCNQKGNPIKNSTKGSTVRYTKEKNVTLRTHDETMKIMQLARNKNYVPRNGIKGISAMVMFPRGYDIINSFSIDFMHGIALGIGKDLIKIWLGKRDIPNPQLKSYKISPPNRIVLRNRVLNLKPTMNFHRKPRSILDISDFKASEVMDCIWYYLRYTLVGLIDTKIIKHFEKLAAGSYILCKAKFTREDLKRASEYLIEFSHSFEKIYGSGAITMNVHLLNHYHEMVNHCGPLWAHSLFAFENNMGVMKASVNGTTDYLAQIAKSYAASKQMIECVRPSICNQIEFKSKSVEKVKPKYVPVLNQNGVFSEQLTIWKKLSMNGVTYTSLYANETRSIDYFIKTNSDKSGKVAFYFECGIKKMFLFEVYEISFSNYHWSEVNCTGQYEIVECSEIDKKMLYFTTGSIQYITEEPNKYSRSSA